MPLRLYAYAAAALAIGALLLYANWQHRLYQHHKARADTAQAAYEAEARARAHEQRIAKDASNAYQKRLNDITAAADLGPVRLCRRAAAVPAATAAPAGSHAEAARHVEAEDAPDIGPALNDFVEDCEANAAQLQSLQEWVRAR